MWSVNWIRTLTPLGKSVEFSNSNEIDCAGLNGFWNIKGMGLGVFFFCENGYVSVLAVRITMTMTRKCVSSLNHHDGVAEILFKVMHTIRENGENGIL